MRSSDYCERNELLFINVRSRCHKYKEEKENNEIISLLVMLVN